MASIEEIQSAIQFAIQNSFAPVTARFEAMEKQRQEDMTVIMDRLAALETRSGPLRPVPRVQWRRRL